MLYKCMIKLSCLAETRLFGQILSLNLRAGDVVALKGDLGAGKTTLSREIVRAVAQDDELEVPSPTYALVQIYDTQRFEIRHYDLYRLTDADELFELGFADDLENVVSLIEWPENAAEALPEQHIKISLSETEGRQSDGRVALLIAHESSAPRMQRVLEIWNFLQSCDSAEVLDMHALQVGYLQGDASARKYARIHTRNHPLILMDAPPQPDGPPVRGGLPYSRIARLAENICPFIAIGEELKRSGFSVPTTYQVDVEHGLAVIEDLGHAVFGDLIADGHEIEPLYRSACDLLAHLSTHDPPPEVEGHSCTHILPRFDNAAMEIEIELLLDWYVPFCVGRPATESERESFLEVWRQQLALLEQQSAWVLRDFHSPNLIWLPERAGFAQVGAIDYQDAVIGHRAYDVVSLLQDARLDVSPEIECRLLDYYLNRTAAIGKECNENQFRHAYALLGAQRNTKILGIFARLAKRDGKSQYLRHIPRLCTYLKRCLEHKDLQSIHAWFATRFPHMLGENV